MGGRLRVGVQELRRRRAIRHRRAGVRLARPDDQCADDARRRHGRGRGRPRNGDAPFPSAPAGQAHLHEPHRLDLRLDARAASPGTHGRHARRHGVRRRAGARVCRDGRERKDDQGPRAAGRRRPALPHDAGVPGRDRREPETGDEELVATQVAVTGAAGQIGYAILFRIASGQLLGPDEEVSLALLEIPQAVKAAEGTALELEDCAFPLLSSVDIYDDPKQAFDGVQVALLIGARPRTKGMERADLLEANGQIFKPQGEALNAGAADDVKILVVGNPANTNALIAASNAPDIPNGRFTAMTRLDENRAVAQLASKLGVSVNEINDLVVWGNHSPTMFPDLFNAKVGGERAVDKVDMGWYENEFMPKVGKRGAEVIEARGASSAASAANAAIDHVRDWMLGADGLRSMVVRSGGQYGIEEGLICSMPCRCSGGDYSVEDGLEVDEFAQSKIDITVNELKEEREAVRKLGLV